ncbi:MULTISPECIES: hypothetical protein [Bacillus subtilis group]|uniref:hypothetical protein n=1 Tax=Bacillus TaxID=1386 RepID=UPI0011A09218|nr:MULTISPECIES: hypothetical protein [Bacillus subtilis group]MBT3123333.1 hypothetical protein [Bacillus inaquosorum]MCB5337197.1 hypothetical protein [Bacillus amyloliquefaciens]MCF7615519.1 hypothetical protein [Bacillus subtilis]QWK35434.1 hypothetical protein KM843_19945 [Bacillus velezensis]
MSRLAEKVENNEFVKELDLAAQFLFKVKNRDPVKQSELEKMAESHLELIKDVQDHFDEEKEISVYSESDDLHEMGTLFQPLTSKDILYDDNEDTDVESLMLDEENEEDNPERVRLDNVDKIMLITIPPLSAAREKKERGLLRRLFS